MPQERDVIGNHVGAEIAVGFSAYADTISENEAGAGLREDIHGQITVLHEQVPSGRCRSK